MSALPALWIGIRTALGFTSSLNGVLVAIAAGISAFIIYTKYITHHAEQDAVAGVIEATNKGAAKAHEKSEKERVASARPGAFDRLRADPATCPACFKGSDGKAVPKLAAPNNRTN